MKLYPNKDGEWVQPIKKGYLMGCCDCGLVHRMDFRIIGDKIQFRAWRDRKRTVLQRIAKAKKNGGKWL